MPAGAVAFSNAAFGAGTGPIHFDNTECSGSEDSLINCSRSSFIRCNSGHSEDAGVRCQGRCTIMYLLHNYNYIIWSMHLLLACIVFLIIHLTIEASGIIFNFHFIGTSNCYSSNQMYMS